MKHIILFFVLLLVISVHSQQVRWKLCGQGTLKPLAFKISPDPPQSGRPLEIGIKAHLAAPIISGLADVVVYYDGIELYRESGIDICKFLGGFLNCPVAPGDKDLHLKADIPDIAPIGGPYNGTISMRDQEKRLISCITFEFEMDPPENF